MGNRGSIHQLVEVKRRMGFMMMRIHFSSRSERVGLLKRVLFLGVNFHIISDGLFIIIFIDMKGFLSRFTANNPVIPHYRINLPFSKKSLDQCLQSVNNLRSKTTPAIFLSINGITQNPEDCQLLHDAFKYTADRERIKVYAFLQERITALSYYVASSASYISANPFCMIGDLTAPHKSYVNLEKLMKYFGIQYERLGTRESLLWNSMKQPSVQEKQLTAKWLQLIKQNVRETIKIRRNIKQDAMQNFEGKLLHPKKALQLKLIDNIGTLQEYKQLHFPNNKLKNYSLVPNRRQPQFNKRQVDVISEMVAIMQMPQVSLLSMEDPTNRCIHNFIEVVSARMQDPQSLEDLDVLVGRIMCRIESKFEENYTMF